VAKLSTKIKQLRQRRDELTEELDGEPVPPEYSIGGLTWHYSLRA
jgi:hypothetical protein